MRVWSAKIRYGPPRVSPRGRLSLCWIILPRSAPISSFKFRIIPGITKLLNVKVTTAANAPSVAAGRNRVMMLMPPLRHATNSLSAAMRPYVAADANNAAIGSVSAAATGITISSRLTSWSGVTSPSLIMFITPPPSDSTTVSATVARRNVLMSSRKM